MSSEPPVRLCCFERHYGPVCPDGLIMCQLCYERVEKAKLHTDENGVTWDVCQKCRDHEEMQMRILAI